MFEIVEAPISQYFYIALMLLHKFGILFSAFALLLLQQLGVRILYSALMHLNH